MDKVRVAKDKAAVGTAVAAWLADQAEAAIKAKGSFTVAFSGGSLPKIVSNGLEDEALKAKCQPAKWQVFFADERLVQLDHEDSNYKAVMDNCLTPLGISPTQVHAINPTLPVASAAQAYEVALVTQTRETGGLDVLLLGMGPDGHTCSLFPGHPLLDETSTLVAPIVDSPKPPPQRITLTYKAIQAAGQAAFVTAGEGKAEMLKKIIKDQDQALPAARVQTQAGAPLWFVDEAAAKLL
eukprot:TRINITY_DN5166_c0_g1_i1.p1 TRINITY_DN5166_c0_g1~~TRINITY_DN5166_c0_g1_i1.p1  ORF type:complete len:270 (+),score=55.34 TRINITY_DN5166_c0_g1_i1:95-811(+)